MYFKIEVINNLNIYFAITVTLCQSLDESAGHFWWTVEFGMWQIQISKISSTCKTLNINR